jgi:KaiC/GvpD/RAD55 family RecA-like ATPase
MATKRKTGTLATAGKKVKKAARAVAKTADEYVVDPVSRALGLKKKKKATGRKTTARSSAAKRPAKTTTAKRGARRK